jgi:hypothetical protein
MKQILILCAAAWLVLASVGQTALAQDAEDTPPREAAGTEAASDDDLEEGGVEDDVFVPSENIEADSEISFPADI